jgi:hypothetical protein
VIVAASAIQPVQFSLNEIQIAEIAVDGVYLDI